ncbi:hypothetical protein C5749_13070 [Sphingobacterium gobiense]|uniref:Uncharacterized protein n=2 Tax=Sphingobacterium gobiense TaxID=1382456 RepID=A0A2S9JMR0_9SPHI|nr:hypothetical protein C5749_13070 [Sphingobacterium gobiense]
MRAFLSSIVLFFYMLTCTGATIYMHQCHGGSLIMLQDKADEHHQSCPICMDHGHEKEASSSHACNTEGDDCCKDIKIDLKKGQEKVESTPAAFSFLTLSPATLSIIWIVVFQPHFDTQKASTGPSQFSLAKRSTPTYLLHCNFRI